MYVHRYESRACGAGDSLQAKLHQTNLILCFLDSERAVDNDECSVVFC